MTCLFVQTMFNYQFNKNQEANSLESNWESPGPIWAVEHYRRHIWVSGQCSSYHWSTMTIALDGVALDWVSFFKNLEE